MRCSTRRTTTPVTSSCSRSSGPARPRIVSAAATGSGFPPPSRDARLRRSSSTSASGRDAMSRETLRTEELLGFAGIEPVEVDAVPLEMQVAEKLHAYTRTYEGGRVSTRPKDLVDLALIAEFRRRRRRLARRDRHDLRAARNPLGTAEPCPSPPTEWAAPFRRLAEEVGVHSLVPCSTRSWLVRSAQDDGIPASDALGQIEGLKSRCGVIGGSGSGCSMVQTVMDIRRDKKAPIILLCLLASGIWRPIRMSISAST